MQHKTTVRRKKFLAFIPGFFDIAFQNKGDFINTYPPMVLTNDRISFT